VLLAVSQKRRPLLTKGPDARVRTFQKLDNGTVTINNSIVDHKWDGSVAEKRFRGSQITDSEEHPGWSRKRRSGDVGGNFTTRRQYVETGIASHNLTSVQRSSPITTTRNYRGYVLAVNPVEVSFPAYSDGSDADLNMAGATAVARCKPTNAVADLSVALGELYKDRLPTISRWDELRSGTDRARKAGNEYLKSEFGWLPLIGELQDFGRAVTRSGEILSQYERDAGRMVRRRFSFKPEQSYTSSEFTGNQRPFMAVDPAQFLKPGKTFQGRVVRSVETYRRRWFSGAFRYSLPVGYNSHNEVLRHAARASVLFGAELTPSTVWNLAPWSWAVDWFSNVGDVLSNSSDYLFDGLVMQYGYIMEHSLSRVSYTYYGEHNMQSSVVPQTVSVVTETKKRRKANPFGFGVSWEGLSPRQIAISVALGLTR
jgi:hypothetical protein